MMTSLRIGRMLGVAVAIGLVTIACGRSEQKEAEDLAEEGNRLQKEISLGAATLCVNYKVNLFPSKLRTIPQCADSAPSNIQWGSMTLTQREEVRRMLNEHRRKVNRMLEIGNHKNVRYSSDGSFETSVHYAKSYLDSLDRWDRSGQYSSWSGNNSNSDDYRYERSRNGRYSR